MSSHLRSLRFISHFALLALGAVSLVQPGLAGADPVAELAAVSSFKTVNLDKLAGGTVQITRGPEMSFARDLAVESVYVMRKPLAATVAFHQQWSPNKHPELKVYAHGDLPAKPTLADFQKLGGIASNSSVKAFATATQKLGSGGTNLQLTKAEAAAFASQPAGSDGGGALPPKSVAFWSDALLRRAQTFLSGGITHLPPYETSGETVRVADEVARLLKEVPKVRGQFSALIEGNPLTGTKPAPPQQAYWEMFDVDDQAAVNLGALYAHQDGDKWQTLDGLYYGSSGYYTLLTFCQFWPVKIGGRDCTLVWRVDLISAASLGSLHGVQRMGSSTAMMRETKKTVESLLKDSAQAP